MKRIILTFLLCSCTAGNRYYLNESNDYLSPDNRDVKFTQGLRLGTEIPDHSGSHEYFAEQLLYTPNHKKVPYIRGERPYAGYVASGVKENFVDALSNRITYGFDLGLVGPHAYGKETQRAFHRLLKQAYPTGWDAQLNDELTVLFTAEQQNFLLTANHYDFSFLKGANLGTLFDQGYAGGTFRIGYHLSHDPFGGPIYPRIDKERASAPRISAYVFVSMLGRAVARNLFLDGNTFQESVSVEKKPLVGEGRLGFAVEYDQYLVRYTYMQQSKEFYSEDRNSDFGEISLTYQY